MTTLSATHVAANRLLRTHLYGYLDQTEFLATKWADWNETDIDRARALIPDLVDVIRSCLVAHADTDTGHCVLCEASWPCPTIQTVHDALTDPRRHFQPLRDSET